MDAVAHLVPKYETYGFRSVWNTVVVNLDLENYCSAGIRLRDRAE